MLLPDMVWITPAAIATGVLGALLGVGGGALIIPILVIAFKVPMHFAIASSLLAVVATSSASGSIFLEKRIANLRLGMTLEIFTTAGGIIGALIAVAASEKILQILFAAILLLTAAGMWKRPRENLGTGTNIGALGDTYFDENLKRPVSYRVEHLPLGFAISFLAGAISGLVGIGGGVIKVPTMVLGMKIPMRAASATSNLMIGVTAIASLFIYYADDKVDLFVGSAVAIGTFFGSLLGANLMQKMRSRVLSIIFSILLVLTALEMFLRASGGVPS